MRGPPTAFICLCLPRSTFPRCRPRRGLSKGVRSLPSLAAAPPHTVVLSLHRRLSSAHCTTVVLPLHRHPSPWHHPRRWPPRRPAAVRAQVRAAGDGRTEAAADRRQCDLQGGSSILFLSTYLFTSSLLSFLVSRVSCLVSRVSSLLSPLSSLLAETGLFAASPVSASPPATSPIAAGLRAVRQGRVGDDRRAGAPRGCQADRAAHDRRGRCKKDP